MHYHHIDTQSLQYELEEYYIIQITPVWISLYVHMWRNHVDQSNVFMTSWSNKCHSKHSWTTYISATEHKMHASSYHFTFFIFCHAPSSGVIIYRKYKVHTILKFECFLSRFTVVYAQSIEARCWVENEDVVGSAPTGDAPSTSELSTILLATKVRLMLEIWR